MIYSSEPSALPATANEKIYNSRIYAPVLLIYASNTKEHKMDNKSNVECQGIIRDSAETTKTEKEVSNVEECPVQCQIN